MTITANSSRACAAQILATVFCYGQSLTTVLEKNLLAQPDRSFIQELCYGTLRWYWQLDGILKLQLERPLKPKDTDIYALLLLGLYQLLHLQTPSHAALHETAQAARSLKKPWAVSLINGVLRQFQREQNSLLNKINQDPITQYAHPAWLIKQLQQAWPNHWQTILTANNERPPMTLRVNRLQISREHYLQQLTQTNINARSATHTTHGIMLEQPCDVNRLPGFYTGVVSVQDTAAQLAADLLELAPGQHVLDACAAPGGKTAHIVETEPNLANLTALDKEPDRLQKVAENLARLQLIKKTSLLCADATQPTEWWDEQLFDRILVDAPCSATGVIRRHPDIKLLRRASDIPALAKTQYQILTNLWPLLKPGGLLVYATCSLLPQENADILQQFLSMHPDAQEKPIVADWGVATTVGRQVFPETNGMDGFYYGRIVKI